MFGKDNNSSSTKYTRCYRDLDEKNKHNKNISHGVIKELYSFLKQFRCPPGTTESNIIDQKKGSYNIPDKSIGKFFDLLDKAVKNDSNIILNFSEKQNNPSGLMFDIDILQTQSESQITETHCYMLIQAITKILKENVDFDSEQKTTYALVIKKEKPVFKEVDSVKSTQKGFKDGFHILIPGCKCTKKMKRWIINKLIDEKVMDSIFENCNFITPYENILDKNSGHVPTLFVGCSKPGGIPYVVDKIFKLDLNCSKGYSSDVTRVSDISIFKNIIHEFSINFESNEGIVKKYTIVPKQEILSEVTEIDNSTYNEECSEDDNLSILSLYNPDALTIAKLVKILNPERCEDQGQWFKIVTCLAYIDPMLYQTALEFSKTRSSGIVREEFQKVWDNGVNKHPRKYSYTKDMIYAYARKDNPEEYDEIIQENIFNMLADFTFDKKTGGYLQHWHMAVIIKQSIGNKFKVDVNPSNSKAVWYEYKLDCEPHRQGEVFKWVISNQDSLRRWMSKILPRVFDRLLEYLEKQKSSSDDENELKKYNNLIKSTISSCNNLCNSGFI